jgi:hypothetical protein
MGAKQAVKTITIRGRAVSLYAHTMPDGTYYVVGRFGSGVFNGTGETVELATLRCEAQAVEFSKGLTK